MITLESKFVRVVYVHCKSVVQEEFFIAVIIWTKDLLSGGWENKREGDTVSHLDGIIFNAVIGRVIELCILLSLLTRQRSVQWVIIELVSFIFQG